MEILNRCFRQASRAESAKVDDAFHNNGTIPGKRAMAKINKLLVGCKGFVLKNRLTTQRNIAIFFSTYQEKDLIIDAIESIYEQ